MAGLIASLAGSGSFAVDKGRFNTINPRALASVMEAAEGEEEPDEEEARETFAIQFGSGALPFGRAAGSFSIAGGVADIGAVSVSAEETTVLADAALDLNTLSLKSEWTVRAEAPAEGVEPHVRITFSGPLDSPDRQTDLVPLLDLLRSRYMQRQLDELEALQRQRAAVEPGAGTVEATAPAEAPVRQEQLPPEEPLSEASEEPVSGTGSIEPSAFTSEPDVPEPEPPAEAAEAPARDTGPTAPARQPARAAAAASSASRTATDDLPEDASSALDALQAASDRAGAEQAPEAATAPERPRGILQRLAPALREAVSGDAAERAAVTAGSDGAAAEDGPAETQTASPPPPAPRRRQAAPAPQPAPETPTAEEANDDDAFRTLPNGVVIKVR
jgi:hypothetical protein